jgi:hypothetical protein
MLGDWRKPFLSDLMNYWWFNKIPLENQAWSSLICLHMYLCGWSYFQSKLNICFSLGGLMIHNNQKIQKLSSLMCRQWTYMYGLLELKSIICIVQQNILAGVETWVYL